jgi:Putative transposase
MLLDAHAAGHLQFFGDRQHLAHRCAFKAYLAPLWETNWFVCAKRPFAGPEQVLAYLSRYTHRVAISNSRLISADASVVTFTYKDYRIDGPERYKTMTLERGEFMRRFLMHVLPKGFHRIRHYGLIVNAVSLGRRSSHALASSSAAAQLDPPPQPTQNACEDTTLSTSKELDHTCPHCGIRMMIIETFEAGRGPRHRQTAPAPIVWINSS